MRVLLKWLHDFVVATPQDGHVLTYEAATQKWKNKPLPNNVKVWRGQATVGANGVWSINFSSAGFTSAPSVVPVGRNASNDRGGRHFPSLTSVTTTTASGTCSGSTSTSLLGLGTTLTNSPNGTLVDILAIGT